LGDGRALLLMPRAESPLTIGALAARTGFTTKALRYYERIGLLPVPPRRPSGYRVYGASDLARLDFIAKAKRLGLSLEEIHDVLELRDAGVEPCVHVVRVIDRHVEEVERAIAELGAFGAQLRRIRRDASKRAREGGICRIIEHVPQEVAIGERARVAVEFARPSRHRRERR
jgi:DNA-binding transcriptional MerR regulator